MRRLSGTRRGWRLHLVLAVLLTALSLALWPSAVLGSESSVTISDGAPHPATDVGDAGAAAQGGALTVDAHEGDDDHHHMWGGDWSGWWIVGPIMMVLFWGAVIALVVWGITQATRGGRSDGGRGDGRRALDIAEERYARGEISREEFEQIRRDLGR